MSIQPIVMPKWGLAMEEGTLIGWAVAEGQRIRKGQEIADIETTKIANVFESPVEGVLRRHVATSGQTLPVGALIAVVAEPSVPDSDIDAFVTKFLAEFKVVEKSDAGGPKTTMIDAGGLSIRTLKVGDGDAVPVLLIHGFGSDLMSWLFTQEPLAESRAVYAFDLPGHGGSTKSVGHGSLGELTEATLKVMDALSLVRAHLVGHSLGGAIAAMLALRHAERVASAVLIAPAALSTEINGGFLDAFLTENRPRKLKPVLQRLVSDTDLISTDMVEDVLKFKRLDGAVAALQIISGANFGGGRQATVLKGELAGIQVPIKVIVGEDDQIIPPGYVDHLPANIAVTRLSKTGHLPHMERSADVNRLIKEFILNVV